MSQPCCRPDTSQRHKGDCLYAPLVIALMPLKCCTVEIKKFHHRVPINKRKCLSALARSKTKHTGLMLFLIPWPRMHNMLAIVSRIFFLFMGNLGLRCQSFCLVIQLYPSLCGPLCISPNTAGTLRSRARFYAHRTAIIQWTASFCLSEGAVWECKHYYALLFVKPDIVPFI